MAHRAYSLLEIKAADDESGVLTGIATTPTPDRMGDIVEAKGAKFSLPLPLLWQHQSDAPIGHVTRAKVTAAGIEITAKLALGVSEEIDRAWKLIKSGLVRGLSIGFRVIEYSVMDSGGWRISEWDWLELSAVTIPANSEATIATVKKFDTEALAASGTKARPSNVTPPATGKSITFIRPKEGQSKMNVGERIAALEGQRKEKAAAMEAIQAKVLAECRTKDQAEREEFDALRDELKTLDAEIADLRDIESLYKTDAKPVDDRGAPVAAQRRTVPATPRQHVEPGLRFAQLVKIRTVSKLDIEPMDRVAEKMYGRDSEIYHIVKATGDQLPGTTASGNWGFNLISPEGAAAADFAEFLRPATILGKFGMNGVPALRRVPFRSPLVRQTDGAAGYWVGEGKPKPLSQLNFTRDTLDPLKCATIVVLSEEHIRDSSPSSDMIVRDDLRNSLAQLEDEAFIDPTNSGGSAKPAGILYAAGSPNPNAIAAETYNDENDVILDIRSLLARYDAANNPASQAVLIMKSGTARAAGLILNSLGQRAFPGLGASGGTLLDIPVITSESVPDGIVAIVNASDVLSADDGEIKVDISREASLEFKDGDNITQNGAGAVGAALVSLWQNNLVGIRAEHTINWMPRRAVVGAYLTGVAWGGEVNAS